MVILDAVIVRWVRAARRGAVPVLLAALAGTVLAGGYAARNLGINTDTADMIAPTLPWRQRYIDFQQQFPQFKDDLVVVLDAQTPDLASDAAQRLADALAAHRDTFHDVQWTAGLEFFRRNALLFLDAEERGRVADGLVRAQPLLGRLHRDPGLAAVATLLADGLRHGTVVVPETLDRFAGEVSEAIEATLDGRFHRLSWRRLVVPDEGSGGARQIVIARPVLDFDQLFPVETAIARVHAAAQELGLTPRQGVSVRVTGGLAMSEEDLRTVSAGAGRAALLAFVGVTVVLALGLGSARLVLGTLFTLVAGLLWTAAFAAAAVGSLNMISVAFAVLYIGLGVDYAVHFGLRYRELLGQGVDHADALEGAAGDVGRGITLCALTTGIGFFAFVPTRFAGVSELGLIAGVGMFISLAATLTLMPALLTLLPLGRAGPGGRLGVELPLGDVLDRLGRGRPRAVCAGALTLGAVAAAVASAARFDDNPVNLSNRGGEAVSTYRELVAGEGQWSLDVLTADETDMRRLAGELEALPAVLGVMDLQSFVPPDQEASLAQVEDLALVLGPQLYGPPGPVPDPTQARVALGELAAALGEHGETGPGILRLEQALGRFREALARAGTQDGDRMLRSLQESVTGTLPGELARLGDALDPEPVTLGSLPAPLRRDWIAPDGRLRLRVDAAGDLNRHDELVRFVEQVQSVAPNAVGTPVVNLESARVVVLAFVQAFALALACIALILLLALRRVLEVAAVLAPLLLAALVSAAVMVAAGLPFNFANVIALPLLLGVGVDSGVHMLVRARTALPGAALAGSSTARAVVTSALTTVASFGNLAFSDHPGTASLGLLLTVGMVATIGCTLLVLPALVTLLEGSPARESHE